VLDGLIVARWRVPVVLITAFGDDATRRHAEALGAVLLDKPLSFQALRAVVHHLAGQASPHEGVGSFRLERRRDTVFASVMREGPER
jgi:hypothetical protein